MGILSGYKRFKKYLHTGEGYRLCSEWTKSDSVEMTDGSTLQESMDTVVSDVESTQNDIMEVQNELKTSLGGMTFGVDAAGRYGYIKAGADTVTPFKKNDWETLTTENIVRLRDTGHIGIGTSSDPGTYYGSSHVYGQWATIRTGSKGAKIIGFNLISSSTGYAGIRSISAEEGTDPYGNPTNRLHIFADHHASIACGIDYTLETIIYVPNPKISL
ncbi:MAG: hypothetical protein K2G16_02930 [Lachnospiraceae bacterium]|nr:hypothetical protein [Lachnospiraceae bacterium]